jgi:hypothetical protein
VSAKARRVPGTGQKSEPLQQAWRSLAAMRRASSPVRSLGRSRPHAITSLLSRLAETPSLMASFSLSSTESRYIGIYHHNLAPRSGTAEIRARIFCDQIRRGYVALFYKPFLDDLRERLRSADHGRTGVARGVIH